MRASCHVAGDSALIEHLFKRLQAAAHQVECSRDDIWRPGTQADFACFLFAQGAGKKAIDIVAVMCKTQIVKRRLCWLTQLNPWNHR